MRAIPIAVFLFLSASASAAGAFEPDAMAGRYVLSTSAEGVDASCRILLTDTQNTDREGYIYFARIEEVPGNLRACGTLGALGVREWSTFGSEDRISLLFMRDSGITAFEAVNGEDGVYRLTDGLERDGAPVGDLILRREGER